jgi:hypothetical protein
MGSRADLLVKEACPLERLALESIPGADDPLVIPWVPPALSTRLSSFNAGFSIASLPRSHVNSTLLRQHAKLIRFFDPDHSYQIARLNNKSR